LTWFAFVIVPMVFAEGVAAVNADGEVAEDQTADFTVGIVERGVAARGIGRRRHRQPYSGLMPSGLSRFFFTGAWYQSHFVHSTPWTARVLDDVKMRAASPQRGQTTGVSAHREPECSGTNR